MSEFQREVLEELLADLQLDIQLATTREQLIRANQRHLKLKHLLSLTQATID